MVSILAAYARVVIIGIVAVFLDYTENVFKARIGSIRIRITMVLVFVTSEKAFFRMEVSVEVFFVLIMVATNSFGVVTTIAVKLPAKTVDGEVYQRILGELL